MTASETKPPFAWQPFTPRGAAAFAQASWGRLLLVQFIVAGASAAVVLWFLLRAWFPVISAAIDRLPPRGELRAGWLDWQGESPVKLAEGRFLAIAVDLRHAGAVRSSAQLEVELGRTEARFFSLLGVLDWRYPREYVVGFNRQDAKPWWGAWGPPILAMVALGVIAGLMLTWMSLATLYWLPVWLLAFYTNRDLKLLGSWRLAGAALMPGAVFQIGAILLYGLGTLDLVRLLVATGLHFVVQWIYLVVSPLSLPPHAEVARQKSNPFAPAPGK